MSVFRRVQQTWVQVVPFTRTRALQTVSRTKIQSLLDSKKYSYKLGQSSFVLQCPFCKRGDGASSSSTLGSMFVNYNTGSVVCKPCAVRGTWSNFMEWSAEGKSPTAPLARNADSTVMDGMTTTTKVPTESAVIDGVTTMVPTEHAQKVWSGTRRWEESSTETTGRLREMFGIEVLTNPALEKYQVHTASSVSSSLPPDSALPCVAFPWYHGKDLVRVRLETIPPTEEVQPSGEGVFGWGTVEPASREIVVAGGEFDAVAVHQSTGLPAVALPSGITKLPSEFLSEFDQFKRIYLWLGSSGPAKHTATHLANQLGLKKCYLVSSQERGRPLPTALEALSNEGDLAAIISRSKRFAHDQIFHFNQLRGDVYGELSNREIVSGVKWRRFPLLTSALKGHRSGELTVLTGPTGRGKTTLLAEMSLDLCLQGVATLWGSFEIKNVRLAKTLLKQYSGVDIERHLHDYDSWADKFQQLPLCFMGFYGSADISTVIETMSHAVYAHNIQHVIVDNLQFMLGCTNILDGYSAQNQAIGALRRFASAEDVHVTVVIHPRKEDDNNPLTTASIFGTAKAAQEADNIIILQCPHGKDKYLQVTKNRFDGDLGVAPLTWDKESCTMSGHFNRPPPPSVAHNKTLTDSRGKLPSTRVAPLTWDKESCTMSGHFNRPPPPSVAHNKTLTDSPGKLPSPHPRTVKELAFGTYRPQGSKLIGRAQNTPVKGTSSGSPLINQASTTSHGPSRRTV